MANIEINSISNPKLKKLALEIDNSKVSAKDNEIDDKEFGIFKQRAKTELLDKKQITYDDYKAIFGLKKANSKANADSLAYVQAQRDIARADSLAQAKEKETQIKNEKIYQLKNDIEKMRNKLYKGKFNQLRTDAKLSDDQKCLAIATGSLFPSMGALYGLLSLGEVAGSALVVLGGPIGIGLVAGAAVAGVIAGGCYLNNKYSSKKDIEFMKQCEQEDPQLYQALQYAKKQLAELQKQP